VRASLAAAALAFLLLADCLHASERTRRICIPDETGRGWICGTEDDPPQPPVRPQRERAPPAPPRFLADPQGTRTLPLVPITRPSPQRPAPVEVSPVPEPVTTVAPLPEPAAETAVAPEPAPAVDPVLPATAEPTPAPVPVEPRPVETPAPEPAPPAPVPAAPPAPETVVPAPGPEASPPAPAAQALPAPVEDAAAPAAPEAPTADPAPAPPADDPAPVRPPTPRPALPQTPAPRPAPAQALAAGAWRVEAALRADPEAWTLQLAHGSDVHALARLAAELGLPLDGLFLLPLERERASWWLLAYGLFDSPEAAREAAAGLPPAAGLRGVWPRRMGPLHNEIERARRIHAPR
jgi:hypothetical protein